MLSHFKSGLKEPNEAVPPGCTSPSGVIPGPPIPCLSMKFANPRPCWFPTTPAPSLNFNVETASPTKSSSCIFQANAPDGKYPYVSLGPNDVEPSALIVAVSKNLSL